jgi:hypothetical protein
LISMAESADGPKTVFACITSSSARLRRLCYKTLLPSEMLAYPSYEGKNFNHRYSCVTLDPIRTLPELKSALCCMLGDWDGGNGSTVAATDTAMLSADVKSALAESKGLTSTASASAAVVMPTSLSSMVALTSVARDALDYHSLMLESRGIAQAIIDIVRSKEKVLSVLQRFTNMKRADTGLRSVWYTLATLMYTQLRANAFEKLASDHVLNPFSGSSAFPLFTVADVKACMEQLQWSPVHVKRLGHNFDFDFNPWNFADAGYLHHVVRLPATSNRCASASSTLPILSGQFNIWCLIC